MRQGKELDKKIRRHRAVLKSQKKEMIGVPKPSVSVGYKTMVLKTSPLWIAFGGLFLLRIFRVGVMGLLPGLQMGSTDFLAPFSELVHFFSFPFPFSYLVFILFFFPSDFTFKSSRSK